jgi:hypothetical protein
MEGVDQDVCRSALAKGVVFKEFKAEALVKCCQDCNVLLGRSPIKYPG